MRIECTTTFLDDRERYETGDIFTLHDDEKAAYFVKNGWAKQAGAPTPAASPAEPAILGVKSTSHKQKAVTNG